MSSSWKFRLKEDFVWQSGREVDDNYEFKDKEKQKIRLAIRKNGEIRITTRYSWDGCTPKLRIFDWFYIGIPDGAMSDKTGLPKAYHASLVHDALYQFLSEGVPYSRREADKMFLELLRETRFSLRWIYYLAVRTFGGFFHKFGRMFRY